MHRPDYIVDIATLKAGATSTAGTLGSQAGIGHGGGPGGSTSLTGRPWLAVHWQCCRTYSRIYRNQAGDAYEGRCPQCGAAVNAKVGPNGVSTRFFTAK